MLCHIEDFEVVVENDNGTIVECFLCGARGYIKEIQHGDGCPVKVARDRGDSMLEVKPIRGM